MEKKYYFLLIYCHFIIILVALCTQIFFFYFCRWFNHSCKYFWINFGINNTLCWWNQLSRL